jgi:hypothetical protein
VWPILWLPCSGLVGELLEVGQLCRGAQDLEPVISQDRHPAES